MISGCEAAALGAPSSSNLTPSFDWSQSSSSPCHHGYQDPPHPYLLAAAAGVGLRPPAPLASFLPEAQAARPRFRREESPGLLSKVQSHIFDYWESAKAKAQELYEKVQIPRVDENLRHVYDKGSEAMTTYTGILTDQIFHMLKGEQ